MEYQHSSNNFPVILGNEEETGMLIQYGNKVDEPYELVEHLKSFVPLELISTDDEFLTNGFRIYPGLALGPVSGVDENQKVILTNLERTTPECKSPEQLALYIRAGELLLRQVAINFATYDSINRPGGSKVRIQRRVVDSNNNRKGCHDNYSISVESQNFQKLIQDDSVLNPVMRTFLASRVLLTGAGYVNHGDSVYYSQKMDGLEGEVGYYYRGSMARMELDEPIDHGLIRFEVRCSDVNISDWATTMRIAGVAICLALLENGFDEELNRYVQDDVGISFFSFKDHVDKINKMTIDNEGVLSLSSEQKDAISFQKYVFELAMSKLIERTEVPAHYYRAAKEMYAFYDELNKIASSKDSTAVLADRADSAAKLNIIINKRTQSGRNANSRNIADDIESCAADLRYDNITVEASNGSIVRVTDGYGIKLRNRGKFITSLKDVEIQKAFSLPPDNTRAYVRGKILSDYKVEECDWARVLVYRENEHESSAEILLDPVDTQLSDYQEEQLLDCRKIKRNINLTYDL